ncbi:MAG: Uma2 family endonuclease [Candidatus Thermofonsia Clade 1 bacterium]|jgi:Uma2 family endonuclease|uniref:Uma2 family endonuclease n=1 Tax=Candidatus Thermofonsia Clade 1 bacterium TaxID=2364210 RepID=A0A2M8PAL8_9CHLR|nr:MAG: Uma2 family endonuclease [Candidatus Thermofonsia Clade 1 bacterium]RMF51261.1 MAG: Uma2 family endonuclease [Chloroflexota bacterium]
MSAQVQTRYTADDLERIRRRAEYAERAFELHDGEIILMSPTSALSSLIATRFGNALFNFVETHDLGYVIGADGTFVLDAHTVYVPDVAFIRKARLSALPARYFPFAPDVAVEVLSPTDSVRQMQRKALRYLKAGTALVWLIYPDERAADACHLAADGSLNLQPIEADGYFEGGALLNGFRLSLADLFRNLPPAESESGRDA